MQTGVWIVEGNDFSKRQLLGKSCMEHMRDLVQALDENDRVSLAISGDAPLLQVDTLQHFSASATETAKVLLMQDMKTPLAIAMPVQMAKGVLGEEMGSLQEVLNALDAMNQSPYVWHDEDTESYLRVDSAQTYAIVLKEMSLRKMEALMENGVLFMDPDRTIVEKDVQIGAGTMVYHGNVLQGKTVIGENCELLPNNRMKNAVVGKETTIENSVLLDCIVGSKTTVGPFAYVRPKSVIGDGCRIGDFVEIKNSQIDDGTKVSHLTYVGDSDLGKDINLGCGVVFVNYDGKTKNRSKVDDHAFIGCNCNLVAPVHVGENAYIAAGSTVVEDVPKDALMVARSRAVTKEDWVVKRKESGKL